MEEQLKPLTARIYRMHALTFFNTYFPNEKPTADRISDQLQAISFEYRAGSWRNLRCAIVYFLVTRGEIEKAAKVKLTKNPVTSVSNYPQKVKQIRCKKVSYDELNILIDTAGNEGKREVAAAIYLAYITGCRPAEMPQIQQVDTQTFLIIGAKKRSDRGLDRLIKIDDASTAKTIANIVKLLAGKKMKPIQNSFDRLAKKVFWRRRSVPSLYSFRHQMGSNLKASGLDRKTIAYMMGHRVTKSVDVYGNRRSGGGHNIEISPAIDFAEIDQLVKENHRKPGPKNRGSAAPK